jgi:hypothetical protein
MTIDVTKRDRLDFIDPTDIRFYVAAVLFIVAYTCVIIVACAAQSQSQARASHRASLIEASRHGFGRSFDSARSNLASGATLARDR